MTANIARHLDRMAEAMPDRPALKIPRGRTGSGAIDYLSLSFRELAAESAAWRADLEARGVRRGDRVLVMVKPGLPLIASAFALFSLGAVPVVIDPGMGRKHFLSCVERTQPRVLLGIPLARILSVVFSRRFRSVEIKVPASASLTARKSPDGRTAPKPAAETADHDLAAILFTSGSTGAPKGVCYEHGMFEAQVRLIRETYAISPGEIDLPLLPIFALFNPALGLTTIVPEIDPRKPAEVDPRKIVQAILQEKVTTSFGSPSLWKKIGDHCVATGTPLPGLKRVLCAGAPVPASLWAASRRFLPNGQLHSPYGATEALPVSSVSRDEVDPASVQGACVGRPVSEMTVRVIEFNDSAIPAIGDTRELPQGEIGEVIVRGPVVTRRYDSLPEATRRAKIADSDGGFWHRMGDCGRIDGAGRIWFQGRVVERVVGASMTFYTEPCEQVFRAHPRVGRCALVGLGETPNVVPGLVVEARVKDSSEARAFARELRALALQHAHTLPIKRFYFHPKFPVDVRHNAKIHRLTLTRWAQTAKGYESDPKR